MITEVLLATGLVVIADMNTRQYAGHHRQKGERMTDKKEDDMTCKCGKPAISHGLCATCYNEIADRGDIQRKQNIITHGVTSRRVARMLKDADEEYVRQR